MSGGFNSHNFFEDTSEVLDLATLTWRRGPDALHGAEIFATTVPYEETFLVIAGDSDSEDNRYGDGLFEYDVVNDEWRLRTERLARPRYQHASFRIPFDAIPC